MTTSRRGIHAVVITAVLLALAACSGSGSGSGSDDAAGAEAESSDVASLGQQSQDGIERSASSPSEAADSSRARPPAMTRAVISNGTISLQSDDVAKTRQDVQRIADAHRAQVSEEETGSDDDGETSYARMVLRVPVAQFGVTMGELEKVTEFSASNRTSEDVTTQVIDTDVRVRAQQASLERVEALLARAEKLRDIVWIESQLTTRQAELDSLRQQQAWLSDQTTLSTITVDITRPAKDEPRMDDEDGFLAGLKGGLSALGSLGTALATMTGALLPFAVVLAVLGMPVWLLVRGRRRRRAAPAA